MTIRHVVEFSPEQVCDLVMREARALLGDKIDNADAGTLELYSFDGQGTPTSGRLKAVRAIVTFNQKEAK